MTNLDIKDTILTNNWQNLPVEDIVVLINEPKTIPKEFYASLGTPMKYLGAEAGATLLETMAALAETNPVVKWGFKLLERGELDMSLPSTRSMLDALLPPEAATALKSLGEQTISANVTVQQVIDAMEGM